jgi:hypothetical protein
MIANTSTVVNESLSGGVMAYSDYEQATNKVGYFRDELYRFAITYYDEFGNYSRPKILDMSLVLANAAVPAWVTSTAYTINDNVRESGVAYVCIVAHTSGTFATDLAAAKWAIATHTDMRFPDRDNGKYGTLLNSTSIQALYLNLMGIDNHPTWAKGFEILRAPRKKKIQFQTPLIPSILVQPPLAKGDYPDQRKDENNNHLDVLNVEAANPLGTYVPKNFLHTLPKSLVNQGALNDVTGGNGTFYYKNTSGFSLVLDTNDSGQWNLLDGVTSDTVLFQYADGVSSDVPEVWEGASTTIGSGPPAVLVNLKTRVIGTTPWATDLGTYGSGAQYQTALHTLTVASPNLNDYLITITAFPS